MDQISTCRRDPAATPARVPPSTDGADPASCRISRSAMASAMRLAQALPNQLAVSVVIPTCERLTLLQRCLDALLAQDFDPGSYEIIVVDDGRDDSVRDRVNALSDSRHVYPRIRYMRPTRGRGPAVARNCGWKAARAPVIAFTDDDTLPQPDWLSEGETAMAQRSTFSALCGRVVVPRLRRSRPTDHERMTIGLESAQFVTANAFVRRDALERVGGFDESFTRAWREDSDLEFRLMALVGPVGKCPGAVVLHPVRAERWGVCLRQQRNGFFDALLYKKHPDLYRTRIQAVTPWNYYLIVAFTVAAPLLLAGGATAAASMSMVCVVALWLQFAVARLRHTALGLPHVLEMLATSAVIPFLSVYWRLRGALRFRVLFL